MNIRLNKDGRGIASVAIVLAIVVVLAVGGVGYYVMNKNKDKTEDGANSAVVINSEAEATCKKLYDDDDLCKFSSRYSGKGPYKATFTNKGTDGKTSVMVMELDANGNSSTVSKDGEAEVAAYISLNGDTYIKDMTDGSWLKYPKSSDAPTQTSPTSGLDINTTEENVPEADRTVYKKIGKEACGSNTCFKYQIIDPASPGDESFIWFSDKDYQLRKWSHKSADGSISEGEFTFTPVTISAPTPIKEAPSVPSQAELQQMLDSYSQ